MTTHGTQHKPSIKYQSTHNTTSQQLHRQQPSSPRNTKHARFTQAVLRFKPNSRKHAKLSQRFEQIKMTACR
eukprot:6791408-Alexandrium_andersonii.AAC.1